MRSLKPSHKERKRYLLIEGKNADKESIEEAILNYVGVLGYAKASPRIVKQNNRRIILSINRKELDKVRAAFMLKGGIKILN